MTTMTSRLGRLASVTALSAGLVMAGAAQAQAALPACSLSSLPPEATTTANLIRSGGPFPYDQDGVVFQNREAILPAQTTGYYHEYTVKTPGSDTRGARRIVTGGTPLTSPPNWYYTGDHYASFCKITGV
ncbi:ribonuclease [Luteipulveratus sp. YIM 133132]|uniref:ribonuclease n=1 Tax=Luteipulveratus flavus TaxID=3031728 RepID=UPI0023B205F8|nr:ribonuclease [Luteipulveratus sp. YIM 133132]MDE9365441.1 ribonuclease [Luteipulveratus sp. YIM 133132]